MHGGGGEVGSQGVERKERKKTTYKIEEKILANHISDKGLVFKIYKGLL